MFCGNCGIDLQSKNLNFCTNCGFKVEFEEKRNIQETQFQIPEGLAIGFWSHRKYPGLVRYWNGSSWDGPEKLIFDMDAKIVGSSDNLNSKYPGDDLIENWSSPETSTGDDLREAKGNKNVMIWASAALIILLLIIFTQGKGKPEDQFEGIEDYDFVAYSDGYDIGSLFYPYGNGMYSASDICQEIANGAGIYTNFGSYVFATSTQMNVVSVAEGMEGCIDGFNDGE